MKNSIYFCFLFLFTNVIFAQELNCTVQIIADKVPQTNKQVFTTLKSAMTDFMNNTQFTPINFSREERIECNLILVVETFENNVVTGTLQVLSTRPVYDSNYNTQILNFKDNQVTFRYIEFEPLTYSDNTFNGDLVGIMSFYANLMIGLDSDSFEKLSGSQYLQKANNFVLLAQQSGSVGWKSSEKTINRYHLINDILSNQFVSYREALYDYHRLGLDEMISKPAESKVVIYDAIAKLENNHKIRPNAIPTRVFFDSKGDEIVSVFSAGPEFKKQQIVDLLNKVYPFLSGKWNKI
ncbi:DUF4835 family protein [Flavobacterium sp. I3-2]|uniref:type IX secretion system protein PorD n=1 Tax=Flavobacterium sp. I3-2 TaxID=2748319 RepID=UPI0015B1B0C4|nr:DUF4835 family protein [Flavobacterium sp. I3-2]